MEISAERQDQILRFMEWAEKVDAKSGLDMTLDEVAADMEAKTDGGPIGRQSVSSTIRAIREHPELRVGVTIRRGPNPHIRVSMWKAKLDDEGEGEANDAAEAAIIENVMRTVRQASTAFTQYRNRQAKTANARLLLATCQVYRGALAGFQGVLLRMGTPVADRAIDRIDEVLAAYPGRDEAPSE